MFRTAKQSTIQSLPTWMLIILVLLVSCLAVHFLIEDLSFLSYLPGDFLSGAMDEELTHQDDLALYVSLLPCIQSSQVKFVPLSSSSAQVQTVFPHFKPPKI